MCLSFSKIASCYTFYLFLRSFLFFLAFGFFYYLRSSTTLLQVAQILIWFLLLKPATCRILHFFSPLPPPTIYRTTTPLGPSRPSVTLYIWQHPLQKFFGSHICVESCVLLAYFVSTHFKTSPFKHTRKQSLFAVWSVDLSEKIETGQLWELLANNCGVFT